MKRLHLFEFNDQRWLPARFREYLTDLLKFHLDADKTYDVVIPILTSVLEKNNAGQLVDICSGSSGPWKRWMLEKKIKAGSVTLTDKFPYQSFDKVGHISEGLKMHPHTVEALNIPSSIQSALTFFTCFHHFKAEDALTILENAVIQKRAICIFEFTERNILKILGMLFSPLVVRILTFKIRPLSVVRIFWTCIVPVVPLIYFWEGVVSHFRTYTVKELTEMHSSFANDYQWESGQLIASNNYQKISYLVGYAPPFK